MPIPLNIEDLLRRRKIESERIEFKKGWNPDSIYHSICAFANDIDNFGGGYILVGVEEENGIAKRPVAGLPEDRLDTIQKEMVGFNNKINPYYKPISSLEDVDGVKILAIWVPTGPSRPYSVPIAVTNAKSMPQWYVREHSSSSIAKGDTLTQLRDLTNRIPFDERPNPSIDINDISPILVADYLRKVNSKLLSNFNGNNMRDILEQMNLFTGPLENRMLKNVAAMVFCENPDKYFPYTQIDVVIFPKGKLQDPNNFSERIFKNGVPWMIWDALHYIQTIVLEEHIVKQKDRPESIRYYNFPYQALEEAVSNALYHRDYQEYEPVEITIEPEEITVVSYAGPDRSIPLENIRQGKKIMARRYRNRRLGDFLKELDLAEGRNTGIPTIQDELAHNGSPEASFETDDDRTYFITRIPCHPDAKDDLRRMSFERRRKHDADIDEATEVATDEATDKAADKAADKATAAEPCKSGECKEKNYRNFDILSFCISPKNSAEIFAHIEVTKHPNNFNMMIKPLMDAGYLKRTIPDIPTSPKQKYVTTLRGKRFLDSHNN